MSNLSRSWESPALRDSRDRKRRVNRLKSISNSTNKADYK